MQLIATTALAGLMSVLPPLLPPLSNPVESLTVTVGGIEIEASGDGLTATPGKTGDFEITLDLKGGTPVRVRL